MEDHLLQRIRETIDDGTCLAFLGSGASAGYVGPDGAEVPGLPVGGELSRSLAESCGFRNGSASDLPKVAEYFLYTKSGNRDQLFRRLRQLLPSCPPRPIHTVLAQLTQIRFAITTNYDALLEAELQRYGRPLIRHVHDPTKTTTGHFNGPLLPHEFSERQLVLHKMHGSIEQPETLVVTRTDYIRYLARLSNPDRGMPDYFRKTLLPKHHLLFLGYSLSDWNFQVIWEGVLSHGAGSRPGLKSFALVQKASALDRDYWAERKVTVIEEDLTDFARSLAGSYGLEIPSLGIGA